MSWNDERVATLKNLWADGHSASKIAAALGNVTRNAVIGKIARLGLPSHATTVRYARRGGTKRKLRVAPPQKPVSPLRKLITDGLPLPPPAETDIPRVSFRDLNEDGKRHCKWPCLPHASDVPQDQPLFCGLKPHKGLPYCEHHSRRAFAPPPSRPRPSFPMLAPVAEKEMEAA